MRKINSKSIYVIMTILIILIILISIDLLNHNRIISSIYTQIARQLNGSEASILSYVVYDNQNENDVKVLFTVSNIDGIEYIEKQDGIRINANGKTKVAFDNSVSLNIPVSIKVKRIGNTNIEELNQTITQDYINSLVELEEKESNNIYTKIKLIDNSSVPLNQISYMVNNSGTYYNSNNDITVYLGAFEESGVDSIGRTQTIDLDIKKIDKAGNIIHVNKQFDIKLYGEKFLYYRGDQKSSITGGYVFKELQSNRTSREYNSSYLYMYALSVYAVGYGELELTTNNAIDFSEYDVYNVKLDYSVTKSQEDWRVHFYYGVQGGQSRIIDIPGTTSATDKILSIDISDLNGLYKPYFRVYSASYQGPVYARIKEIWLSKK